MMETNTSAGTYHAKDMRRRLHDSSRPDRKSEYRGAALWYARGGTALTYGLEPFDLSPYMRTI